MIPLVSVIIPTANRPQFLPRAVESALAGLPPGEVEVIVVPNGPDQAWLQTRGKFAGNAHVRFEPIETGHACAARNHGLSLARGKLIRFLDDDDHLYPDVALTQYRLMESSEADICSAGVDVVDAAGRLIKIWPQPATDDFVVATLSPSRMTWPGAHVFRRDAIRNWRWDEDLVVRQDTDWMIRLCTLKGLSWVRMDGAAGAYVQHRSVRVSRGTDPGPKALRDTAEGILKVVRVLDERGELSLERRVAASDGLWSALQKGFMYEPRYWMRVGQKARVLAEGRRPPSRIYHSIFTRWIDPLWLTAALAPARFSYMSLRRMFQNRHAFRRPWFGS